MLPFFQENLPIFTGIFYIFHREPHDFLSEPKNRGIDKKISIPGKSIDTSPITMLSRQILNVFSKAVGSTSFS